MPKAWQGADRKNWWATAKGYQVSFSGDKYVLKSTVVIVANSVDTLKTAELYTLKWGNCRVCELYLSKAVVFKIFLKHSRHSMSERINKWENEWIEAYTKYWRMWIWRWKWLKSQFFHLLSAGFHWAFNFFNSSWE